MSPDPEKTYTQQNEYNVTDSNSQLIEAAVQAADAENSLSRKELFARYKPAVFFSAALSVALVMEGMDVGLINNFFAQPDFLRKFGWPDAKGKIHVSTSWQAAINNGNNIGSVVGLLLNGFLQSRYGSRRVYMGAMCLMACTIFVLFFAVDIKMLFAGNILCGIPWGKLSLHFIPHMSPDHSLITIIFHISTKS